MCTLLVSCIRANDVTVKFLSNWPKFDKKFITAKRSRDWLHRARNILYIYISFGYHLNFVSIAYLMLFKLIIINIQPKQLQACARRSTSSSEPLSLHITWKNPKFLNFDWNAAKKWISMEEVQYIRVRRFLMSVACLVQSKANTRPDRMHHGRNYDMSCFDH
jgi:hypothetical protein